jgi:(p)ppGpp synthase/HD superfamily hydrolase
MKNLFEAIEFAVYAHSGQFRKGTGVPYIVHPMGVAKLLIENDYTEAVVIAGLLHDTVEDTRVTLQEIRAQFGDAVAELVAAVTELPRSFTWEQRKQDILTRLATAPREVLALECADKLDNIREIQMNYVRTGEATWERFNRPKLYQHWYYASLAELFSERVPDAPPHSLFREFASAVESVFDDRKEILNLP